MISTFEGIIKDIRKALDYDCYYAALSLALMLPDICGKAEYPKAALGKRYIDWYDEYIGKREKNAVDLYYGKNNPYLSGEIVYRLRCTFLHHGNPEVDNKYIKEERCHIDKFAFFMRDEKHSSQNVSLHLSFNDKENGTVDLEAYGIDVRHTCLLIAHFAEKYYENNKEKFDFFNSEFIDLDDTAKKQDELKEYLEPLLSLDDYKETEINSIVGKKKNGNYLINKKIEYDYGKVVLGQNIPVEITPEQLRQLVEYAYSQGTVSQEGYQVIIDNISADIDEQQKMD